MKFILNNKIKHYTKETFRWINLIAVALFIVMTVVLMKYKIVYAVSISGEQIGYIENKEKFEKQIEQIVAQEGTENIAFVDIQTVPQYKFTFVNKNEQTSEDQILAKIEEGTKITYKFYAITVDEKQKAIVNSLEEAEELVADMKKEYKDTVDVAIGINEVYTENKDEYKTVDIKVAKETVEEKLEEIEDASVNKVYLAQKPVSGIITSRFGNRESIRTHAHTGLDIAAPAGTDIKSASKGTVKFSGDMGSYGNLIIINAGNGVEIYYGHCSKLYVSEGEKVEAGDVIGAVGSTGNSTGNHLHFEIRVNGTRVNPQNYIYN